LKEIKGLEGDDLYIRDLHIWGDKLYLATRSGILCTSDLREFQLCIPELTYSMSGIDDDGQQLLFSSFSRGLFYYNPTSRTLKNREFSQTDFRIDNILVDSKRTIWLSTQSTGIIKITGNKTEYLTVETG